MEDREGTAGDRPQTSLTPPPDCNDADLIEYLLEAEKGRLATALQIERDRATVFPETTVIIRDIQKLHGSLQAIREREQAKAKTTEPIAPDATATDEDALSVLLRETREELREREE